MGVLHLFIELLIGAAFVVAGLVAITLAVHLAPLVSPPRSLDDGGDARCLDLSMDPRVRGRARHRKPAGARERELMAAILRRGAIPEPLRGAAPGVHPATVIVSVLGAASPGSGVQGKVSSVALSRHGDDERAASAFRWRRTVSGLELPSSSRARRGLDLSPVDLLPEAC